ncbi:MAG: pyridoxamine 5'-phosphate oxidase family protein [Planctomycetaceae bacterium]
MDHQRLLLVRSLLDHQQVASLGTLHQGRPAVSMTPFAVAPESKSLILHVSGLASHTRDMLTEPGVSLMVMADRSPDILPQALPRLTIAGLARVCDREDAEYAAAKAAYLDRFPDSEMMFSLGDFALFLIEPQSVRVVAGFGQAWSLTRTQFREALTNED